MPIRTYLANWKPTKSGKAMPGQISSKSMLLRGTGSDTGGQEPQSAPSKLSSAATVRMASGHILVSSLLPWITYAKSFVSYLRDHPAFRK